MKSTIQCEFCKKTFNKNYIKKHQTTAKFCLNIQNKNSVQKDSSIEPPTEKEPNKESLTPIDNETHISQKIAPAKPVNLKIEKLKNDKQKLESKIQNIENYKKYMRKIESILCDYLGLTLTDKELKKDNINLVILDLMNLINNYQIKGIDKKNIIVNVVQKVINNLPNINTDIKTFINIFLPHLIDTFISISKNKLGENSSSFFPMPLCI